MPENKKILQITLSAILALAFVQFYLKGHEHTMDFGYGMENVVVAAVDIPSNRAVRADMLTTRSVASRDVEPGAFQSSKGSEKEIVGKVTVSAILSGGQILQTNLIPPDAHRTGVSPMLSAGKRGYVLRLANLNIAKLIIPGDHIDILATFSVRQKGEQNPSKATYTILQDILVAAVDKDIIQGRQDVTGKDQSNEGRLLTLQVDPFQAEKLVHASIESSGEISVVVRPHGDDDDRPLTPVSAANILSDEGTPTPLRKPSAAGRH